MKKILALVLATALTFLTGSMILKDSTLSADAAVSAHIFCVMANPGVNCNTEVGITWTSTFGKDNCVVEYKPKASSGWDGVTVVKGTFNDTDYKYFLGNTFSTSSKDSVFSEDDKFYNYDCDLTGLTPNTEYKYRIGDGEGGYSSTHYFKTSGADEFSFVWISDFHTYSPLGGRLSAATSAISYAASQAENGIDMIFSTGDTVAYGGSYYFWKQLYDTIWSKRYLYIDINGNHDNMNNTDTNNTFNYFRIMHNNPENCFLDGSETPYEPGVVYWFMYGDILWFVFDNETMNATVRAQVQEWAGKVIESMEGKYRYLFISEHYQWFRAASGSDSHYGNWSDFCDKYGVDIAFSGNDHIYARTHKLYKGEVVAADSDVGTYYIQAPSADCERGSAMNETLSYNADIIAKRYVGPTVNSAVRTHGVSLLDVTADGINFRLFGSENASQSSPVFELKDSVYINAKRTLTDDDSSTDDSSTDDSSIEDGSTTEPVVYGDVNGDEKVSPLDASLVLQYNAQLIKEIDVNAADVNGDGKISPLDASLILQYNAQLIKEFPCENK